MSLCYLITKKIHIFKGKDLGQECLWCSEARQARSFLRALRPVLSVQVQGRGRQGRGRGTRPPLFQSTASPLPSAPQAWPQQADSQEDHRDACSLLGRTFSLPASYCICSQPITGYAQRCPPGYGAFTVGRCYEHVLICKYVIFVFSKNGATCNFQCATSFGHQTDASDTMAQF